MNFHFAKMQNNQDVIMLKCKIEDNLLVRKSTKMQIMASFDGVLIAYINI